MKSPAPGIPIHIQGDPKYPIGRLYIRHRQMHLEFPIGVTSRVIDSLFPGAQWVADEESDGRVTKARIVRLWWVPSS